MQPELAHKTAELLRSNWTESSLSAYGLRLHEERDHGIAPATVRSATAPAKEPSLQEKIFTALADAKIWTSKVAMHMPLAKRDSFFRQLDLLHDCDEWFDGNPVSLVSYQGFVTFMLTVRGNSKPSLGLAPDGQLVAVWQNGDSRLTIQFKDRFHAEWVLRRRHGDEIERAAGVTTIDRISPVLLPYDPEVWFGVA